MMNVQLQLERQSLTKTGAGPYEEPRNDRARSQRGAEELSLAGPANDSKNERSRALILVKQDDGFLALGFGCSRSARLSYDIILRRTAAGQGLRRPSC